MIYDSTNFEELRQVVFIEGPQDEIVLDTVLVGMPIMEALACLESARQALLPGGKLTIRVPNFGRLVHKLEADAFRDTWPNLEAIVTPKGIPLRSLFTQAMLFHSVGETDLTIEDLSVGEEIELVCRKS